jgi:LysR family transcriptional regulator of gallate degradation
MLPLRHIRAAHAVLSGGGVRSSSESLLRAASAVSRSVSLLERAVGLPLFERKGRGMLPTPAGLLLKSRFQRLAGELETVIAEANAARAAEGGEQLPLASTELLYDERRLAVASLLADVQHMPTAGRLLGIGQPAVSHAVAQLETALRQKLFIRSPRGLLPTDLGTRWVLRFDRVLAELRYLQDDLAAARGRMQGWIMVGALPLSRTHVLPRAISALQSHHPGLRVRAIESPYEELCAGLLSGKVDFIIGAMRPETDGALRVEPLFADDLRVIASAKHPLHRRRRVALADLRDAAWVLSRPGSPLRSSVEAFFAAHGEPPPVPMVETGDLALVRGMLLEGGMLTVLSTHQLRYELDTGQLCELAVDMKGLQRQIGLTTRSGAHLPASVLALLDEIRRAG